MTLEIFAFALSLIAVMADCKRISFKRFIKNLTITLDMNQKFIYNGGKIGIRNSYQQERTAVK